MDYCSLSVLNQHGSPEDRLLYLTVIDVVVPPFPLEWVSLEFLLLVSLYSTWMSTLHCDDSPTSFNALPTPCLEGVPEVPSLSSEI